MNLFFSLCLRIRHYTPWIAKKHFNQTNRFRKFPEFARVIYRNSLVYFIGMYAWEKFLSHCTCTLTYFVAFGMQSEGNLPKNGNAIFDFSFTKMLQHTGQFWSRIVWKEQCDDTGASPTLSWPRYSWFLSFPSIEIRIEGTELLWCYGLH